MDCGETKQVILYSQQLFLAQGLGLALQSVPGLRLSASFDSLEGLLGFMASQRPEIVLVDSSEELTAADVFEIVNTEPRSRVVLWAADLSLEMAFQALNAGVKGVVRRTSSLEKFVEALSAVAGGELWFEEDLVNEMLYGRRVSLTPRESQLVGLIARGLKNREIGEALGVTEGTIKVYLSRLYKKLGVNDRYELAVYGLKNLQVGAPAAAQQKDGADFRHADADPTLCFFIQRERPDAKFEQSAAASPSARGEQSASSGPFLDAHEPGSPAKMN